MYEIPGRMSESRFGFFFNIAKVKGTWKIKKENKA